MDDKVRIREEFLNEMNKKEEEINNLINNNKELSEKYNRIINSRSWKITRIYRKIGGFIKKKFRK